MYKVIKVIDGWSRQQIDITGVPNRYGKPKLFKTKKEAQKWIDKNSYPLMSFWYEIKETED